MGKQTPEQVLRCRRSFWKVWDYKDFWLLMEQALLIYSILQMVLLEEQEVECRMSFNKEHSRQTASHPEEVKYAVFSLKKQFFAFIIVNGSPIDFLTQWSKNKQFILP